MTRSGWGKTFLLLAIALAALGFVVSGAHEALTLDGLKTALVDLRAWRDSAPAQASAIYFAAYVLVAALSLPGAAVMTLAGGALFGLVWGLALVSFASSVGAVLAFLAARYLLRDWVRQRFGSRLGALQQTHGGGLAFYLFTLRLVPVFPFFLVNLLMGLVPLRTWTFYWVSQLGMLPGTVVYVNAGTALGQVQSLGDIVSAPVLGAFILLGLFPLLARYVLGWWQRRRVYARWTRPRRFDRNLVVIGAGAAGLVTAYIAAAVKARVTLVESHRMGGDCLNYGCVPSKALIRSARLARQMRQADRFGLEAVEPRPDFRRVMDRVQTVIRDIAPHDSVERYTALGVEVLQGHARLVDPWTVEIRQADGSVQRLSTRSVVIAAGARPFVPSLPGLEAVDAVTSDTLWERLATRDAPPGRLVVLGGGPIGCELAQALASLGSAVTLVEMAPRLLTREDPEVSELVTDALVREGVEVLVGHQAVRCETQASGDGIRKFVVLSHQGQERSIPFDELLCALGRVPRLSGYGLEELGIQVDRTVVTNEYLETVYPNIFAAGDVAGPYQFTHMAAHQAWYAAVNALFGNWRRFKVDYRVVPAVTFVDPEVARVGLNEQEAQQQGIPYEVTRYGIDDLDRAIAEGAAHGFVKVLTVPGRDRILGVTIVGEQAGELLAEYVLAMKHGLGLNRVLGTIHAYPTLSEANKYVAGEWKRAHAPQRLLRWVARYHAWRRG